MKRRRAIVVLQEGSGSSGWKSRRKHRRLEERAVAVASEGFSYNCNFFREGNEGMLADDSSKCDRGGRRREAVVAMATTRVVARAGSRGEQGNGRRMRWLATGRWEKSNATVKKAN
ncbi:hypothetical protein B296_00007681 [Ensete ventricosum]|uniref:Uncharacterized protein n=1 Tax=Ensete ventricosum TaxID=4639 RepID=A0A427BBP0_ENSVE|nr:hypothetical protein B296_00007681 [Ensete ventricosum]